MKTFKIVNGDLVFDSRSNLVMIDGYDEEVQSIERLLTTNTGEWFLNTEHGLEYTRIRGKGISNEQIRLALMKALAQEDRIERVESISIKRDRQHRTATIHFRCKMKSGNIIERQEVLAID